MRSGAGVALTMVSAALFACGGAGGARPAASASPAATYPVRGTVKAVAPDRSTVTIDHEEIPDFMDAMEMDFTVPDPSVLQGIEVGTYVEGDLQVKGRLMDITRLAKVEGGRPQSPPAASPSAPPGPGRTPPPR